MGVGRYLRAWFDEHAGQYFSAQYFSAALDPNHSHYLLVSGVDHMS